MKIRISGSDYDPALLSKLSLFDLLELKKQTGLTVDDLQDNLAAAGEGDDDGGKSLLASEAGLLSVGALIWLARRKAGERLTLEEACDFPLEELSFVEEPGDVEAAAPGDPT